jgi:hypothetical protein
MATMERNPTSHVTRNTSHVTRQTPRSNLSWRPSAPYCLWLRHRLQTIKETGCLSHVTRHTSHVTRHTSPEQALRCRCALLRATLKGQRSEKKAKSFLRQNAKRLTIAAHEGKVYVEGGDTV